MTITFLKRTATETTRPAPAPTGTSFRELNALLERSRRPLSRPVEATDEQVLALAHRWNNSLAARLDQALETGQPVAQVWRRLAADRPDLRGFLDAQESVSPELLARARRAEYRMLAVAAGLVGLTAPDETAVPLGRRLVEATGSRWGRATRELAG